MPRRPKAQAWCQFLLSSAKATSTTLSLPRQPRGPGADGLLRAGAPCSQLSPGDRARRCRGTRWLPDTPPHPATAPWPSPEQALHLTTLRPLPFALLPARLSSALPCLPAPSLPTRLPADTGVGALQGFLERAGNGGRVGGGNVANLVGQTAGLVLSFSTCSPALFWHKGAC